MDNLVNSLVGKTVGLTAQQMQTALSGGGNNGAVNIGGTWYQPQYDTQGSGETQTQGPLTGYLSYADAANKAGGKYNQYDAQGNFVREGTQQKVNATKDFLKFAALAGGGLYGLNALGAAGTGAGSAFEALNAGAGAFEGGTALNTLAAMTPAELAAFEAQNAGASAMTGGSTVSSLASMTPAELATFEAQNAGATAMTDLGASELANAGASANTIGGTTIPSAVTPLTTAAAAKTLIDPTTGLLLNAAGSVLGNVANQSGIDNARDAITQGGATANTALNRAYTDATALNTAGRTDLANNYLNLNTNLNNTLAGQKGIYDTTGTNLANNYLNLNTNLNNTLAGQVGAYNEANQGIKANAATQLGLLGSTYQGQKDQAAANASALNTTYGNTRGDLYDIYNKQVGIQQPYQDVGRAGSQGLINNQGYLTHQFDANDLNAQLAPNYAFQLAQGQMANQRLGNMGGGALGGNVAKGLQDYTQNYASGAYQNAFNNYNTQRQNIYSTLAGMANIGTTSGGQLASLGNTLGGNLGSLSSTLGSNLTTNAGNLLNAGNAYGTNTSGVTNNLNNVLSSNLGQLQGAYNQYGSNLTSGSNTYAGNVLGNANTMQNAYNQYGTNLLGGSTNYANNLTTNTNTGVNAANVYGLNSANLAIGTANALASNATQTGANNATGLNRLGDVALLGSMIKAT
jgi:hypothetical protein